jgi:hypothetical protein
MSGLDLVFMVAQRRDGAGRLKVSHMQIPKRCPRRLRNGQIAMQPLIVAEIALDSLRDRWKLLDAMEVLLEVKVAQPGRSAAH